MGQTWNGDLLHDAGNVVSDIGGFFSGPPGDPGRIRQVASQIQALRDKFDSDRRGLDEAVDELTRTWRGDGATAFATTWYGGGGATAPAQVLNEVTSKLDGFVRQLRDYADQLEHAQHEHWIQMGIMAALTVVNVAQLGLDPATDAAEVGAGTAMAVGSSFALADVGTFAIQGAVMGFGSVIAQLGADVWDHLDSQFDQTGDHAVGLFNGQELALSTAVGAGAGALFGGATPLSRALRRTSDAAAIDASAGPRVDVRSLTVGPPRSALAYPGGLGANDALGGHVVSHIGISDSQLAKRGIPIASTFADRAAAESSLADTIAVNEADIQHWLASAPIRPRAFAASFDKPIGRVLYAGSRSSVQGSSALAVLFPAGESPLGFFILTGYVEP